MRIRNNEEIPFEEAKRLLANCCGREDLQRKVDSLAWLLRRHIDVEPFRDKPQVLREPEQTRCAECGVVTYPTARLDLCEDCYDAI